VLPGHVHRHTSITSRTAVLHVSAMVLLAFVVKVLVTLMVVYASLNVAASVKTSRECDQTSSFG
jgi:hypothetical protein